MTPSDDRRAGHTRSILHNTDGRLHRWTWLLFALVGSLVGLIVYSVVVDDPAGDPGRLQETQWPPPDDLQRSALSDATDEWGLDELNISPGDALSGGAVLTDLDGDGDLDLVAVNGSALVVFWEEGGFGRPVDLGVDDAVGVTAADIDVDGWIDILLARNGDTDSIFWGGEWTTTGETPQVSTLEGANPSAALIAADFDLDGVPEILRLGRGSGDGEPDVIWSSEPANRRAFGAEQLPDSDRISLAAEVADIDHDGLLDIWVTRDVGYSTGGDSIYSRKGDVDGEWTDIATDLGAALENDGMGVTLADLDADGDLDAYVSDIGDNEILLATSDGFVRASETGAARIRPVGSDGSVVSSSWASGAADINLDGRLDLVVVGGGFPTADVQNKIPETEIAVSEPPAILLGIGAGKFVDDWPALSLDIDVIGRALTMGDIESDGDTDLVIIARDGTILALRNDITAPSLTVTVGEDCGVGNELVVATGAGEFRAVIPAHTYGGMHATQMSVGAADASESVRLVRPGAVADTEVVVEAGSPGGREHIVLEC